MPHCVRTLTAVVSLLLWGIPAPAQEQDPPFPKFAIGVYSGGIFFSDFNEGENTRGSLSLEPGFVVGMQAETWLHPQFAIRMNGAYTERPFELESEQGFRDARLFDGTFGDVNVWEGDMTLMLRPLSPKGPLRMIPFLAAGAGVVHYNPAGEGRSLPEATVFFDEETKFAAVGGVGLDIIPNTPTKRFGAFIRMEVTDHYVFDSPAERLALGLESDDDEFDGVHNLRVNLGMNLIFPLRPKPCDCPRAAVAAASPPPPPPPPVARGPEMRGVRVCVVQGAGLGEVEAIMDPATGDTLVGGRRFAQAFPATAPDYAAGEAFFINNAPITVMNRRYVKYGLPRVVAPGEVTRTGEYEGVGVFTEAGIAGTPEVVYVPVRPGCELQPYRHEAPARGVRG